ncbi:SusC/RagA family TonB-linked outer membrane protein [Gelidibacter gilvus]|uniref:SusC/RagA family TonB-linked outer membrane protein n=1 Tax=Gelidibacter gilvus TaxID=59602 RepID=A0A4Q0XFD4_9FLAO|nr:SusC/RagA family TonB-linked outer membrane protein [Gelidibacter gilvus]RXJ45389.1 SusC/RagA family TonB-linked outer membrane protein [Gelidibacter gilvus]
MKNILLFKSNSRFCCLLIIQLLCLPIFAFQQQSITGIISDVSGALPGASVLIKGTTTGTLSDEKGYYAIQANSGDVLVFSHLGYKTVEIKLINQPNIDVLLKEDIEQLAAVEITGGYYALAERTKTGNVTKIGTDQLQQQVIHSPMEALQGRVTGIEIEARSGLRGHAPIVTIRGQSSLRGIVVNSPLYIIDGIQIDNSEIISLTQLYSGTGVDPLASLDPSLIESIEILKDADATAIYGSRGANGVIIINTKRGQAGKTKFELQSETGVSWVGKFLKLMNTQQYLEMRREAFENDEVTPTPANAPDLLLWGQNGYTDWQKELIGGKAEFQKYQATISGGSDQTSFLLSGGIQKEGTVFPGDFGFHNNNLLANINHRSQDKRLQLNTSINYGYRKSNLFDAGIFVNNGIRLAPNAPALFDEKGNVNWEVDEHGNPTFDNPITGLVNPNVNRILSFHWNGQIRYNLFKDLYVGVNLGFNHAENDDKQLLYKKSSNPLYMSSSRSTTNQRLVNRRNLSIEPLVKYSLNFKKHKISSLIGTTFQKNKNTNKHLRGVDYFSESQVGNIALAREKNISTHNLIKYHYAALFARIGYSYADKYYLNLTGRRDGSSRFGENNRFGNFGAIAVAWEFYKESLAEETMSWLSYGKLRGSYGTTGSDNVGDYQYRNTYSQIRLQSGSLSSGGLVSSRLHNPYYQWEKNTKLELNFDWGLWKDKVILSTSWYRNRSDNQLIGMSLPSTTGFNSVPGNFPATVENTGWEIVLQTTPIQTSSFVWNSNLNLTIPKNRLVDFPGLESSSYAPIYEIGKSLNIRKHYHYTGINSGTGKNTYQDINSDGIINYEDQQVITDLSNKFYGGWNNTFQYKNWSFSFLLEFTKQKGTDPLVFFGTSGSSHNMPIEILDRWHISNPIGKHPAYTQNFDADYYDYIASDAIIVDASFVRMKSLSLHYQLPVNILHNLKLQQAQIYLNAQNLFTLTPYKGYDAQSPDGLNLPTLTSVHLGIKLVL